MKTILLTNDDGIDAPGIHALEQELKKTVNVYVSAPKSEMSGVSQSITLRKALKIHERDNHHAEVDGTPADSVAFALRYWLSSPPDAVISGINFGQNLGEDVLYSGTVAAAREGALGGFPSLAVSLTILDWLHQTPSKETHFETAAIFTKQFLPILFQRNNNVPLLFNMNCPNLPIEKIKEIRCANPVSRTYLFPSNPKKNKHEFHLGNATSVAWKNTEGSDYEAVTQNAISVTALPLNPSFPMPLDLKNAIQSLNLE